MDQISKTLVLFNVGNRPYLLRSHLISFRQCFELFGRGKKSLSLDRLNLGKDSFDQHMLMNKNDLVYRNSQNMASNK